MISHIYNNLYIGNASDVHDNITLDNLGITSIVNVALDLDDGWNNKQRFFKVGLTDGSNNKGQHYLIASNLVRDLMYNEKILLHCHEGRSRSAFIATLALKSFLELTYLDIYTTIVCKNRPLCCGMSSSFKEILERL